jgi:hypothetical protein
MFTRLNPGGLQSKTSAIQTMIVCRKRLRWSRGTVLTFRTQSSRGQTRAENVGFFGVKKKILSTPSFQKGSKAVGPMS